MKFTQVLIITNNPIVNNIADAEIYFVDGNQRQVLYQVLNKIAGGHNLLSHPLAGSIKPEDNPYRSVVLTSSTSEVDLSTLGMLEYCLEKVENGVTKDRHIIHQLDRDFQIIDKELLDNALQSLI
ncbi:MAG: hypothetical protein GXY49_05015 [Syntrophomonadaceae bacterium]|nr:hypothetical protein [Syntrophomonadaceae bacterium]